MKYLSFLVCVVAIIFSGCDSAAPSVKLAVKSPTDATKYLYRNLAELSQENILFGHQDDRAYGVHWWAEEGGSDVKAVSGSYPALHGWDIGKISQSEANLDSVNFDDMRRWIISNYENGSVNTVSWHMYNPTSSGDSWDTTATVKAILPDGVYHNAYVEKLDKAVDFFRSCQINDTLVPIIFRPFHEHNGNWFWWGKGHCIEEDYIALWRFTFDYFEDKGLNNLIWAFSPDRSRLNIENARQEYLYGYPGDDYVDIIGLDNYADMGRENEHVSAEEQIENYKRGLRIITELAREKNKIAALSETGLEQIPVDNWFTKHLLNPIKGADDIQIAYIMVWRNANQQHFYASYPGHRSEADFKSFYQDPIILLESDLDRIYE